MALRDRLIRLAHDRPELRPHLLPILAADRSAMEFPTEDALKKYLKDHPDADKSKHSVGKGGGGKTGPTRPGLHRRTHPTEGPSGPTKVKEKLKAKGLSWDDFGKDSGALSKQWKNYQKAHHWAYESAKDSSTDKEVLVQSAQDLDAAEKELFDAAAKLRKK